MHFLADLKSKTSLSSNCCLWTVSLERFIETVYFSQTFAQTSDLLFIVILHNHSYLNAAKVVNMKTVYGREIYLLLIYYFRSGALCLLFLNMHRFFRLDSLYSPCWCELRNMFTRIWMDLVKIPCKILLHNYVIMRSSFSKPVWVINSSPWVIREAHMSNNRDWSRIKPNAYYLLSVWAGDPAS